MSSFINARFEQGRFSRSSAFESPYLHPSISLIFNCEVIKAESSERW